MQEKLLAIKEAAFNEIATAENSGALEEIRVKYLGKKGELTTILRGMGSLSPEERPVVGKLVNEAKGEVEAKLEEVGTAIKTKEKNAKLASEVIDISLPGKKQVIGKRHPLDLTLERMKEIFISMGFSIEDGPEVELDHYNFEALNIPKDHPARSEQDTFYINDNIVLRTQTSPIQIRTMENQEPPIKMISPGKVYRSDAVDATHSPIFTEPSAEMDATCFVCEGKGCRVCKGSGWIEILGCGMVHPNVLRNCGIDPEVYSGFAFGFGVDRMVMLKYGIDDIRALYESDMRFLNQF